MNNNVNNRKDGDKKKNGKFLLIYVVVAFLFLYSFSTAKEMLTTKEISYNEFVKMVENKEVKKVTVDGTALVITPQDSSEMKGKVLYTGNADNPNLIKLLIDNNVEYYPEITKQQSVFMDFIIINVLPLVIMFFIVRFVFNKMSKKMGGGPMGMGGLGKSNAKVYVEKDIKVSFEDVAGQDEAKESLTEIIDFLHNPKRYTEIGAKLPKGALLVGPPGTGKTLIAKAVAGEAKVPFLSVSGSTFIEMFVGMGAAKVRDLFKEAEKMAPCIIFIDEIDSIGKSRDSQMQSNDEREQTLNQLLTEMDGFDTSKGIVILGATNRPEILDKALLRPGRFDRRVIVDRPDLKGRIAILNVHSKDVKMSSNVNLESIAKGTPGAVGADLANIVNEAALRAVRSGREEVIQEDLEEAVEVIIAGKEKKDRILSNKEREVVAFHEVGHALVAGLLEGTDPVHKITIVPRTMGALGYTMQLPEEEKYLVSKEELMNQIMVMLGGRAAEEEGFNLGRSFQEAVSSIGEGFGDIGAFFTDPLGISVESDLSDVARQAEEQEVSTGTIAAMNKLFDGELGAFAYLLMVLLYLPCGAAMGAIYREVGSGWAIFSALWTTAVGYSAATIVYQAGSFNAHPIYSAICIAICAAIIAAIVVGLKLAAAKENSNAGGRLANSDAR